MVVSGSALQTTLKTSIDATGFGLHSGKKRVLRLHPAPIDHGIAFRRVDLADKPVLPASWQGALETPMCTTLSDGKGAVVRTVEHLMAALSGLGVDNCLIDIDGDEVPGMDGSASAFVFLIECAGLASQNAPRRAVRVVKPVEVRDGASWARLEPAADPSMVFEIDFAHPAIGRQRIAYQPDLAEFKSELAGARTFGFMADVERLHQAGQALGASLANTVVLDGERVLNPEGLRFTDEFVRHKLLDAVGDMALAGAPLLARASFHRSSHALNRRLLAALFADRSAWARVNYPADLADTGALALA